MAATYDLQVRWFAVFFAVTAVVNVPFELALYGVWGGRPGDSEPDVTIGPFVALFFGSSVVLPALVTALHVRIVQQLGAGEEPTVRSAFRLVLPAIMPAMAAVLLYTLGVAIGFFLLVVPGVYLMVAWYFAAQAAVVEGFRGALERSQALVNDRWWTVAGRLLAIAIVGGVVTAAPQYAIRAITGDDFVSLAGSAIFGTIGLSIHALFGTLLFFSLRADRQPVRLANSA